MVNHQPIDNLVAYMDPLLIDYSLLISKETEQLEKLNSALSSWGCFQLINHGISSSFLDEMKELSKQFFALPMEEKRKYAVSEGDANNGYQCQTIGSSNSHVVLDWNEGLNLTVYPEDRRQLKFWPEKPLHFKKMLDEYAMRLTTIFDIIFKMLIRSLNVEEKSFANRYGKSKEINARFNFYPRCPNPPQGVLGLKPHADFSALTIILQDEEGLQVIKDGQWFMVPVIRDALFVNIGDPFEIMSNGIFKSAVHRVVTNVEKARVSLAMFWDSDRNCEIGPLDELITVDRPQLYERVLLKDYINKYFEYYQSGHRQIDILRI